MKKLFVAFVVVGVTYVAASCATAVDVEPPLQGAETGMFLTVLSVEGAAITGTATANRSNEDAGAGFTASIDTAGRTFLPMGPGTWTVAIRDENGTVLDCDPFDATMSTETGIRTEIITCNLPSQP